MDQVWHGRQALIIHQRRLRDRQQFTAGHCGTNTANCIKAYQLHTWLFLAILKSNALQWEDFADAPMWKVVPHCVLFDTTPVSQSLSPP